MVQLAAGTYRVAPGPSDAALVIAHSGVVLRGEGMKVTDPVDHAEGEGMGDTLWPPSLYDHQLKRRLAR